MAGMGAMRLDHHRAPGGKFRGGVAPGRVEDVAEDVVAPMLTAVGRRHDFTVDHAALDFYGLCVRCRGKRR